MNDSLIEAYRNVITAAILSDGRTTDILRSGDPDITDTDALLWTHLCPQRYVPGIVTKTGSYILYDLDERARIPQQGAKNTLTDVTIYFWVLTHRELPLYGGRLRNDLIAERLKALFGGNRSLGTSPVRFIENVVLDTKTPEHTGRRLIFTVSDWTDRIRRKQN